MKKILLLIAPLMILGTCIAQASPITYTETATATGTLGADSFTDALLTLTFSGDTTDVTGSGGFFTDTTGTMLLTIAGLTTNATVTDAGTMIFNNQTFVPPTAGFGSGQGSILDTQDNAFGTYDLTTDISITNTAFFRSDLTFATSQGGLNIQSINGSSTFTASTGAATPEPATLAMFGLGFAGIAALKRLRA